jgi:septum formation protein
VPDLPGSRSRGVPVRSGRTAQVVLASGSPQRAEILTKLGVEFEVVVPGVEELTGGDPAVEVVENARRKAHESIRRAGPVGAGDPPLLPVGKASSGEVPPTPPPARVTIACDTDVVLDGKALGKPADESEARGYLERMSGRAHVVMSGLVVLIDGEERSGVERTTVAFTRLSEPEIERYVAFGEWRGRSGGYAIQTLGSTLVERIEGSVSNVVGLPVGLLIELVPELIEPGSAA